MFRSTQEQPSPAAISSLGSDLVGEAGRWLLMQDAGKARCLPSGLGERNPAITLAQQLPLF